MEPNWLTENDLAAEGYRDGQLVAAVTLMAAALAGCLTALFVYLLWIMISQ